MTKDYRDGLTQKELDDWHAGVLPDPGEPPLGTPKNLLGKGECEINLSTTTDVAPPGVELRWLAGPEAVRQEKITKKGKLPQVKGWRPRGKCFLVYQDPEEEKRGRIIIPENSRRQFQPTEGTIIVMGDGYDPDDPDWPTWQDTCPYQVGTKVTWSRYEDTVLRLPVEEDWWDSPEERERESRGREVPTVPFTLLHVKDVLLVK